ncbi:unnamed protein product [Linum trigynum]|uniref:Reverse transcriptase domain-containing protein n=1 Tax=Linum trigynum TaxID=586398 RepID=A0AAV2DQD4_9ROSI
MNNSVLAWNVRGLGESNKRARVKSMIRRCRAAVIGLIETKWNECSQRLISSVSGSRSSSWVAKNASDTRGGIAVFWEPSEFCLLEFWEGRFSLAIRLRIVRSLKVIAIVFVYGPHENDAKLAFLSEIDLLCRRYADPICFLGDFNMVRSDDDYRGAPRCRAMMAEFNSMVNRNGLIDLPLQGAAFTRSSGSTNPSLSRIDRALINTAFEVSFSPGPLLAFERVESDHNPIRVHWGLEDRVRRPWRFENMWLLESFMQSLVGWWNIPVSGSGLLFRAGQRLKQSKQLIKSWNVDVFGRVQVKIENLIKKISEIDLLEEAGPILESQFIARSLWRCELDKILLMEEISWRQKSRELWIKVGDKNSGFFHRMANFNRRRNTIQLLKVDNEVISDGEAIKQVFIQHFQSRFSEEVHVRPFPVDFKHNLISLEENHLLTLPFQEAEIWKAVNSCGGDKAPGPDGFTLRFFQKAWNVIKHDILRAADEFFLTGFIPDSVAHSFICLVPKKTAPEEVGDFRPISLVGSLNKILSKLLFLRLQPFMNRLVSRHQFAGLKHRQIHEAALIANELVDSRLRSGRPGVIFKLDIEKAFDSVNWSCLFNILKNLGLCHRFCKWLKGIVCCSKLSILVNGEAGGFFQMQRGLKQGDSLSPFLFSLVMDLFSFILQSTHDSGLLEGFFMDDSNRVDGVNHLLYADDAIVFCDASEEAMYNLAAALVWFQTITGLKVNFRKSFLFPVGDVANMDRLAEILGCEWKFLHTIYLGLPLGAPVKSNVIWNKVIDKVEGRLAGWMGKYLSFGGRVTLCVSVLAAQVNYLLSLFKAPAAVLDKLDRLLREFIWSGTGEVNKLHLVAWDRCKLPRSLGGLGIPDLRVRNQALLLKWCWRFAVERTSWWRELIKLKFPNSHSDWSSGDIQGRLGCSLWAVISKMRSKFWSLAHVDPGSGHDTSFWFDVWVRDRPHPLAVDFPRVAAAAIAPNASIADLVRVNEGSLSWVIPSRFTLRGGAGSERSNLFNWLNSLNISSFTAGPPRIVWNAAPDDGFSTQSAYAELVKENSAADPDFPFRFVWQSVIPPKVCAFLWTVFYRRILTHDVLRRRGWSFPSRCSLCECSEETLDHLFITCSFSREVWRMLSAFIDLRSPSQDTTSTINGWPLGSSQSPKAWCSRVFIHAFFWRIWLERNSRIFRDEHASSRMVSFKTARLIADWLCAGNKVDRSTAEAWMLILKTRLLPRPAPTES